MERLQRIKSVERFAQELGCGNFEYRMGCKIFTAKMAVGDAPLVMHNMASCCIIFCKKGYMTIVLNNIEHLIQPNALLVYRPNDTIEIRPDSDCKFVCAIYTAEYLSKQFHIHEDVYSCMARLQNGIYMLLNNRDAERLDIASGSIISSESISYDSDWLTRSHSASMKSFMCMVMYLIEAYSHPVYRLDDANNARSNEIFNNFVNLVSLHFKTERRVDYYAAQLCISPKYLSHIIKEKSGKTASRWIRDAVAGEINYLVNNTAMSIKEISNTMNFPNSSFFCKYFKKNFGVSPGRHRG